VDTSCIELRFAFRALRYNLGEVFLKKKRIAGSYAFPKLRATNQIPIRIRNPAPIYGQKFTGAQMILIPKRIKNIPMSTGIQRDPLCPQQEAASPAGRSPDLRNADAMNPHPRPISSPGQA
jgi:hypothetical protein